MVEHGNLYSLWYCMDCNFLTHALLRQVFHMSRCLPFSLMLNNTAENILRISLTWLFPLMPTWLPVLPPHNGSVCLLSPWQILPCPWIPSQFLIPRPRLFWSGSLPPTPMAISHTTWCSGRDRRKTVSCMNWIIASKVSADRGQGGAGFTHRIFCVLVFWDTSLPSHFQHVLVGTHTPFYLRRKHTHGHSSETLRVQFQTSEMKQILQ